MHRIRTDARDECQVYKDWLIAQDENAAGQELPAVNSASRPASDGVCFSKGGPGPSSSRIRDSA